MSTFGLYLHIPFCVKKCNYCDFLSFPAKEALKDEYVKALAMEMQLWKDKVSNDAVDTIFIGGGTPSLLTEGQFDVLQNEMVKSFHLSDKMEYTIECNPGTVDAEKLKNYKKAGVNRISFGLQSTISSELACLGRIHSYDDFLVSFHQARECGFANINVDLMSAIPEQTVAGYEQTLTRVCELAPEHISSYSLILEEGTPFYEKYGECPPVSEEEDRQMYELTKERLSDFGYHRYEISNYAKAGKECDHNKKYWKRFPYLGLGLGASSCMENVRFSNERNFKTYGQKIKNGKLPVVEKEELTKKDRMAEFMYLGLRMMEGVSRKMFYQNFLVPMETYYQSSLEKCIREGLIKENGDRYCLTDFGIDVSNRVFAEFI